MASIDLENVEKWFGNVQVIKGIDLHIRNGEFIVFVGPSGCGKSTLLRMIAGLEETSRGRILLDGEDVTDRVPSERGLSMVFQSYALYPHMNVYDNIGFGLKTAHTPRTEIASKVKQAAAVLKLDDYLDRRPKDLSGGQRQRVAIGRAIVRTPKGFLFDEPLSNLDAALRVEMRFEIAKLHDTLHSTMIYVTHDQIEAMTLADRIVVLNQGKIMQFGSPQQLYDHPDNLFVARFIGSPTMNVMPCRFENGQLFLAHHSNAVYQFGTGGESVHFLGIRPEHIALCAAESAHCTGRVDIIEYLGADTFIHIVCDKLGVCVARTFGKPTVNKGDRVGLRFDTEHIHCFDQGGCVVR